MPRLQPTAAAAHRYQGATGGRRGELSKPERWQLCARVITLKGGKIPTPCLLDVFAEQSTHLQISSDWRNQALEWHNSLITICTGWV